MVISRLNTSEFKEKRSSRAVQMATAGKSPQKIKLFQQPIVSPANASLIGTQIRESTKLIKQNGETVEVVTLTLATSPDLNHLKTRHITSAGSSSSASKVYNNLNLKAAIDATEKSRNFPSSDRKAATISARVIEGAAKPNDSSSNKDQGEGAGVHIDVATGNQGSDFLIVTSTPSGYTAEDADGKLTFITTSDGSGNSSSRTRESEVAQSPTTTLPLMHVIGDESELIVQTTTGNNQGMVNDYSSCLICGDKGSGFHYSVFSCEGCKGFFKRSVQKNLTYTCKNDGNCDITKYSRNNCQYCRFRKCLQFGMKKEGVRDDRTPGGLTRARFKRMRMSDLDIPSTESEQSQYQLEGDIQILVNCDPYISPSFVTTEEKTATLYGAFQLTAILYDDMIYTVRWAKQVLGFKTLEFEDQKKLLQSAMIELSLLRLAYRSVASVDGRLRFAHDIELTLAESEQLGFDPEYIEVVLLLIERLKALELDDKEYAIICAIMLFYEDAIGLRDTITVLKLQQKNLTVLQRYVRLVYAGDMKRYGRILLRLPGLRTVALTIEEVFERFIIMNRPPIEELIESALADSVDNIQTVDQVVITTIPDTDKTEDTTNDNVAMTMEAECTITEEPVDESTVVVTEEATVIEH